MTQKKPFRVYVAGASKEPERCRWAMDRIREAGGEITLDWLAAIEAENGVANEGLTDEKRRHYAMADAKAVASADLVWLLAPENPSTGAWTELGIALHERLWGSYSVRVVVSGPARIRSIFCALADFETDDDVEALAWIKTKMEDR